MSQPWTSQRPNHAQSASRPGQGLQQRPSTSAGRSSSSSNTPRALRLWRAVTVLTCLASTAFVGFTIGTSHDALGTIESSANQIVNVERAKAQFVQAEAQLANGLATTPDKEITYKDALAEANGSLASAYRDTSVYDSDDPLVSAVGAAGKYIAQLGETHMQYLIDAEQGKSALRKADQVLHQDVIQPLDGSIDLHQKRVDEAKSQDRWLSALLLVPLLVLLLAGFDYARRTRRLLNSGLLVAVAAMGFAIYQVEETLRATEEIADSSRNISQRETLDSARAVTHLAEAHRAQGLALAGALPAEQGERQFNEHVDVLRSHVEKLHDADYQKAVDSYVTSHQQLQDGLVGPDRAAVVSANEKAAAALFERARDVSNDDVAKINEALNQQKATIVSTGVASIALSLLAAVAAGFGLSQPLRRYR